MKKIWLVGISKGFKISNGNELTKIHTKYQAYSTEPIKEIPNDIDVDHSLWLADYVPDNFMDNVKGFETYYIEYTDNEEKVKQAWYYGVLSTYKHFMWLADGCLIKLDKRSTRSMKRIVREANKHREENPHLWI